MGRGCTDNKHSLSRLHYKASSMKLICQIMKGKCRQGCCVKTSGYINGAIVYMYKQIYCMKDCTKQLLIVLTFYCASVRSHI